MQVRHLFITVLLTCMFMGSGGTASGQVKEESFSFIVLGHIRGIHNGELSSQLDVLLDNVKELKPDMVFLTGDMIWGYVHVPRADPAVVRADWDALDAKLDGLGVPVYRVPGNHDLNDPVTRDIYFERYGNLPASITHKGSRFLLLNSTYVPEGANPPDHKYIRTKRLDSGQVDFIRKEVSNVDSNKHVFLFMHHVLWWKEDAPWWDEVHPVLSGNNVRAAFAGDMGPMKFSHIARDGIDYIQSLVEDDYSINNKHAIKMMLSEEECRMLATQFDNFLHVKVNGPQVDIKVMTTGALSSGKLSPQRWRAAYGPVKIEERFLYDPEASSFKMIAIRLWDIIGSPKRLVALLIVMGGCFITGVASSLLWKRRKKS